MKCFHHNDLDGRCSAAIVKRYIENQENEGTGFSFIEMDYKDRFPIETVLSKEEVWIVDFSIKPEIMEELLKVTSNIIWIDHHVTAKDYPYQHLKGIRDFNDKSNAACELVWSYCFPKEPIPLSVQLVGDYDKWALKYQPQCFEFYEGLKIEENSPTSPIWDSLFLEDTETEATILANGKASIRYRDSYCKNLREYCGYETEIDGQKAYATNMYMFGSKGFGDMMDKYDLCIAYVHDGKSFTVSCYSTKIDVSVICKNYGGGGHKGAAGFVCKVLPFIPKATA